MWTGATGHAEAVAVTFDPEQIPADVILDAFFTMHYPRQLNRQGKKLMILHCGVANSGPDPPAIAG